MDVTENKDDLGEVSKQLKTILSNSNDAIITTNNLGLIKSFNPAAELITGYKREEVIDQHIKIIYESEAEFIQLEKILAATGKFLGKVRNKKKDGEIIICQLSASILIDDQGEVIGTMGISRDITQEIKIKKDFEQLVSNVSDIIYRSSFDGRFVFVNQTLQRVLGYLPEEAIGLPFTDFVYKEDIAKTTDHYISHIHNKRVQSYLEFRALKKNGDIIWVGQQVTSQYDPLDPKKIIGFYGVVRDIDERKKSELLLQESEERYRELFDNSSDLIQSIDHQGKIIYVNEQWKKTLGYTVEDLKNLDYFALIHPNSLPHCQELFGSILRGDLEKTERVIYDLVGKGGRVITVEGAISAKKNSENQVISIQSFLRDITKQKLAESELAKKEKSLRQITDTINDVFYLYNTIDKKCDYVSPNCKAILGCDQEFFFTEKKFIKEFCHPDDLEIRIGGQKALESGVSFDLDYRIIVSGEIKWINEKSFPLEDDNGNIIAFSGVCRDITELKNANLVIYNQNIQIGSSILYAKRLQEAALPDPELVSEIFEDSFIIFKPKDVLSGDFYIIDQIRSNEGQAYRSFVVGDCTGHGIPGAVLSLMCNVLLRESFSNRNVNSPGEALDFVRGRLINLFNAQKNEGIRDGMDAGFCVINSYNDQLYYAGANNSCYIIRSGEIIEIKGNKQHIGVNETYDPYTTHVVDLQENDVIILSSDGYFDQFGGSREKKFTKRKFLSLALSNEQLPLADLGDLLSHEFEIWKGHHEQTDDVTVIGVKYTK